MDEILHKNGQKKLSADCKTKKEDERRAKALSDEISRLEDAENVGILKVAKSLLDNGMPLYEVVKHTPYNAEEVERLLKRYNLI